MQDFITYITNNKGYSPCTARAYAQDITAFLSWGRKVEPTLYYGNITRAILTAYVLDISNKLSAASVARKISALRQWLQYHVNMQHITANPAKFISSPKIANTIPDTGSYFELSAKINIIANATTRAAAALMLHCGLRISEVLQLRKSDALKHMQSFIVHGKGNKERVVPYTDSVRDYLNTLSQMTANDALFAQVDERTLRYDIYKLLGITPHALRHTYATHLLNAGMPITSVQALLGHNDVKTTQRYARVANGTIRNEYLNIIN